MDPTAEELHHTRHFAAENNWKRKCAMEPSFVGGKIMKEDKAHWIAVELGLFPKG